MTSSNLHEETLRRRSVRELIIIGVICAVSWVASEKLDLFEQFYSTTRKTSWLDEVVFAGST